MTCTYHDHLRATLFTAIDNGTAVLVPDASFVDGIEQEYDVDFYRFNGATYRCTYNRRDTTTRFQEVYGDDLEEFDLHHGRTAA